MQEIEVLKPMAGNGREWVDSHQYVPALKRKMDEIQVTSKLSEHNKRVLVDFFERNWLKRG